MVIGDPRYEILEIDRNKINRRGLKKVRNTVSNMDRSFESDYQKEKGKKNRYNILLKLNVIDVVRCSGVSRMKYIKFTEQSMLMFISVYGHFGRFISIIKDCVYLWKFIFL